MINEENKRNTISRNFLVSAAITIIIGLVNMVYPIVIGLVYNAELIGSFTILIYWAAIFSIPIQNGISPAISKFLAASDPSDEKSLEKIGIKLSTFYLILLCVIFPFLSFFAFKLTVSGFFIILILIIVIVFHYLFRNTLQGKEKYSFLLKIESIAFVFFLVFAVIFGVLPGILNWPILSNQYIFCIPAIVYHLVFDCIFLILSFKDLKTINFLKFPNVTKKILIYALLVGLGSLLGLGLSKIQIIISDSFLSDYEVGVLSFWSNAVVPFSLISITLSAILVPRISNLNKFETRLVEPFVNKVNWALSLTSTPIIGLLFLLIAQYPNILDILTLSKYNTVMYWPIIILFCFQATTSLLSAPILSYFASSEKKIVFNLTFSLIYLISVITSWILFVPILGIFGFAGGIAIGGLIGSIFLIIIVLILSKGKVGSHIIYLLSIYGSLAVLILVLENWLIISIIVWSIFSIPSIIIGIRNFIIIIKEKEYSFRYSSENIKSNNTSNNLEDSLI